MQQSSVHCLPLASVVGHGLNWCTFCTLHEHAEYSELTRGAVHVHEMNLASVFLPVSKRDRSFRVTTNNTLNTYTSCSLPDR